MNTNDDITGGSPMHAQEISDRELGERILLIESMMQAGRKTTEYWGWNFLLWGVAYLVAIAWASFLPYQPARQFGWPVTMIVAVLLTITIARRRTRNQPRTEKSRHVQAIWTAVGSGIFVFAFSGGLSGHLGPHTLMPAVETLLGVAHIASGISLRWKTQIAVGLLWWLAAIVSCFVSNNGVGYVFLAATLVCMIGFGIYLMVRESRDRARTRATQVQHA